jgi:hypothetical protein
VSFLADEQNFSAPLVGPMLGNVRSGGANQHRRFTQIQFLRRLGAFLSGRWHSLRAVPVQRLHRPDPRECCRPAKFD